VAAALLGDDALKAERDDSLPERLAVGVASSDGMPVP
jgi:hypothetical protein